TASLASSEVERLFELIRRLRDRGISIVYISHRLEEISQVADRVSILRDGVMVSQENVADVSIDRIIELMTGEALATTVAEPANRAAAGREGPVDAPPLPSAAGLSLQP